MHLLKNQKLIKELFQVLNHIDLRSRNTLKSGILEIPDMLQIRLRVKWDYYVVKDQDLKDLQSQHHQRFNSTLKSKRENKEER